MEFGLLSKLTIYTVLMAAMAYHIDAASIPLRTVRLLSETSTGFVAVTPTGDVHARESDGSNDEAKFYQTSASRRPGYFRFQSVKYPDLFLILENGELKAGTPGVSAEGSGIGSSVETNNDEFMMIIMIRQGQAISFFQQQEDCYIAFNEDGTVHGPCGLSISAPETHMQIVPVLD